MLEKLSAGLRWLLDPEPLRPDRTHTHLWVRWIFLRAFGLIYFSAFLPLLYEIRGMLGPNGILPVVDYLQAVAGAMHAWRFWYAPTVLWLGSSNRALLLLCWLGLVASICVVLNLWPRLSLLVSFVCFLSFVSVAQEFASFQSDGMLLEAGFIALFFAPAGLRPGLGAASPPSRASLYLLRWEWFRIYFESGVVKIASGDPSWRSFTAMDDYYQNGPLPTWVGWYLQHLPHSFHAATALFTLFAELVLVWMLFLPRRLRIICFCIVTPFQIGIILTANYTFLNYLVLLLGVLLLDDRAVQWALPASIRTWLSGSPTQTVPPATQSPTTVSEGDSGATPSILAGDGFGHDNQDVAQRQTTSSPITRERSAGVYRAGTSNTSATTSAPRQHAQASEPSQYAPFAQAMWRLTSGVCLGMSFYVTTVLLLWMFVPTFPFPESPVRAFEPSRIANRYGLFAVMTHERYEIEFQGSSDGGKTWTPYPFRFKPQALDKAPGIYAPYQPRFEWCLWFASLDNWRDNRWVVWTEERLLKNDPSVLQLFASNPFAAGAPTEVRSVIYQYWFTDRKTKQETGAWWRREVLGDYAPTLELLADGKVLMHDNTPALQ
jgi:lipase maturation factor 1